MVDDGYVAWYRDKLWHMLPAIYRTLDGDGVPGGVPDAPGPLRELINRIATQTAVLRRDIDRLWENQSIETCDDWIIPYIGDLLGTRLVSCLDAPAQRLDVANTIYYRRRVGTLGLLEQLAADIAHREARAVEFFRRLGRTRHQFDPPIGNVFASAAPAWAPATTYAPGQIVRNGANGYRCASGGTSAASGGPTGTGTAIPDNDVVWAFLDPAGSFSPAVIEGLAGAVSRTPAGGFADLRKTYAAANTNGPFDEFSHTADLRRGAQSSGWHNISHLGVFIWWRHSFPVPPTTPVGNGATPPCFTFDPTGRDIPLMAPSNRIVPGGGTGGSAAHFGEDWVSPDEWQLPVAVREGLWNTYPDQLYPKAFSVGSPSLLSRDDVRIHPERGLFSFTATPPETVVTTYHFGFMSSIGAGGFDTGVLTDLTAPAPPVMVQGGGNGLNAALGAVAAAETVEIADSLTYTGPAAALALPNATFVLQSTNQQRPVIRWGAGASPNWTIKGSGGALVLQGVWLQGADLVLDGDFDSVTLRMVTLDPGSLDGNGAIVKSIDNLDLKPVHLVVRGRIKTLILERSITGPIGTAGTGLIETLTATASIIQSIVPAEPALTTASGTVSLFRCTVLGQTRVHRLNASECILDDVASAEDAQDGCVRFSAYARGSAIHAPYRSVAVPPRGPVFVSRRFGDPDYARLLRRADAAILSPGPGDTIAAGARDGSEMGAFGPENIPRIKRGLAIKFEEYAPLGVYPVWIDAN